jgi:hypothetical protein
LERKQEKERQQKQLLHRGSFALTSCELGRNE